MTTLPPLGRPTPARRPSVLVASAAAVAATIALIVIAAACGGGSAPARPGGSSNPGPSLSAEQLSFSRCMRSHGVSRFPDPDQTRLPKESASQLGVSPSLYQAANRDCERFLPSGGSGPNQAQLAVVREQSLLFSQCMRRHSVDLPDPDASGRIPDPASVGIDQASPQFEAANQACGRYRPPYMPSNEAYNAWARSQGS